MKKPISHHAPPHAYAPKHRLDNIDHLHEEIARNPLYRVMTVDGVGWICPYTGTVIQAPFGCDDVAKIFLERNKPWQKFLLKTPAELSAIRWLRQVREKFETEPRLKIFHPDGRWLNPYSGRWEQGVALENGRCSPATLENIANLLSKCPLAQNGSMLAMHALDSVRRESMPQPTTKERTPATGTQTIGRSGAITGIVPDDKQLSNSTRFHLATPAKEPAKAPKPDLDRARSVMEKMLHRLPVIEGFQLALHYEPHEAIGGDFYDFIPLDQDSWLIVIGDVAGHGAEAALVVASALKTLRFLAKPEIELPYLLETFNDNIRNDMPAGYFITVFAAILDSKNHTVSAACAGHHPALLCTLKRPTTMQQVGKSGAAIGVMPGELFGQTIICDEILLHEGDTLLMFTDGAFEMKNAQGLEFGHLRTMGSCIANLEFPVESLVSRMVKEIKKFAGGPLPDDLTMIAIKVGAKGTEVELPH